MLKLCRPQLLSLTVLSRVLPLDGPLNSTLGRVRSPKLSYRPRKRKTYQPGIGGLTSLQRKRGDVCSPGLGGVLALCRYLPEAYLLEVGEKHLDHGHFQFRQYVHHLAKTFSWIITSWERLGRMAVRISRICLITNSGSSRCSQCPLFSAMSCSAFGPIFRKSAFEIAFE